MRKVLEDLYETRIDSGFPGLKTHAHLWTPANILFYSTATDSEFDVLGELGGVNDHYLSHRDEAGPMLARIADRFGSALHAPAADLPPIARRHSRCTAEGPLRRRQRRRDHPDTGAFAGQRLLSRDGRRGEVPVHR